MEDITLDNVESLLKDTASGKIDGSEFKIEYNNIVKDANAIIKNPMITRSQKKNSRNFITVDRNWKA